MQISTPITKRPLTAYFLFVKEKRDSQAHLNHKELSNAWKNLPAEEKSKYISEYQQKQKEFVKYMVSQGFLSMDPEYKKNNKFSPIKDTVPDHVRRQLVKQLLANQPGVKIIRKHLYKGFSKIAVFFKEVNKKRNYY